MRVNWKHLMGKLVEKLERAEKGAGQALGFGAAKRESIAPVLLLGAVAAGNAAQAKAVTASGIDGALLTGIGNAKQAAVGRSVKAFGETLFGVWTDEGQPEEAGGADFQVFSSDATPAGALTGEGRTLVMQVQPELPDSLLRTIDQLPVDAFLVALDAPLTVAQLMRLARVRGATSKRLLVHLGALPAKADAEQLRDAGASALVVDAAGQTAAAFGETLAMLRELPQKSPRQRDRERSGATVPQPSFGAARSAPPPPPDDDDDWDDD